MTTLRRPRTPILATTLALILCAPFALGLVLTGCHDAQMKREIIIEPSLHDALPAMPDTPVYYVTVTDPETGEPLATVKISDNPAKTGTEGTRVSIANAIRHVGTMLERADVSERAADIRFWYEDAGSDLRRKGGDGVICTCGSIKCPPDFCGANCSGACGGCFWC